MEEYIDIESAIEQEIQLSKDFIKFINTEKYSEKDMEYVKEYILYHRQIASWLTELKEYKMKGNKTKDYQVGYKEAIDEFTSFLVYSFFNLKEDGDNNENR